MEHDIQQLIEAHIARLQQCSYADILALPSVQGQEILVNGKKCGVTTYVQALNSSELLATVQFASPICFGVGSAHTERGLVFSSSGNVREATPEELLNTGG